jgi:hypothetical protein
VIMRNETQLLLNVNQTAHFYELSRIHWDVWDVFDRDWFMLATEATQQRSVTFHGFNWYFIRSTEEGFFRSSGFRYKPRKKSNTRKDQIAIVL